MKIKTIIEKDGKSIYSTGVNIDEGKLTKPLNEVIDLSMSHMSDKVKGKLGVVSEAPKQEQPKQSDSVIDQKIQDIVKQKVAEEIKNIEIKKQEASVQVPKPAEPVAAASQTVQTPAATPTPTTTESTKVA